MTTTLQKTIRYSHTLCVALILAVSACTENGQTDYEPDQLGPFDVGHAAFVATDGSRNDRALPVELWYPVDPGDGEVPPPGEDDGGPGDTPPPLPDPGDEVAIRGRDHPCVAVGPQVLARVEAEAGGLAEGADLAALVGGAVGLGTVLDDDQVVLFRDRHDGIHVGRLTIEMNRNDGARAGRQFALHIGWIKTK